VERLNPTQQAQWKIDGYFRVEQALSPEQVEFFNAELDRIRQLPGWEPNPDGPLGHYAWLDHAVDRDPEGFMDRRVLLHYDQAFLDLMDAAPVYDLVTDIMGPYVVLSMTQAIVRPHNPRWRGYTHTDGGQALRRIRVTESSLPLAMKALYLLSDVTSADSGNFTVFPGSHQRPFPEDPDPRPSGSSYSMPRPTTPGAVQLTGKAGDCILFPHSLWHGPAVNSSGRARKTILYNYCQLFMRTYDPAPSAEILERCTPRQRRLLGDLGYDFRPGSYFYAPEDQHEVMDKSEMALDAPTFAF